MTLRLEDTTAAEVASEIRKERHRLGAAGTGMVMTLIIIADEENQNDASLAASYSAGEHPCRILTVIPRPGRGESRLDAAISVGENDGPGELVRLRLRGPLAAHGYSIVLPLLLSDTPVVAWWPSAHPVRPSDDPLGALATRRIIDTASDGRPFAALASMKANLVSGDTDLAWTRITPWRSALAAVLDQPYDPIISAEVRGQANPSAPLLRTWLEWRLGVPVSYHRSRGPAITDVILKTTTGDIAIRRPDGHLATVERAGTAVKELYLPRRDLTELIAEELRRLDPDDTYEQTMARLQTDSLSPTVASRSRVRAPDSLKSTRKKKTSAAVEAQSVADRPTKKRRTKKAAGSADSAAGAATSTASPRRARHNAERAADAAIDNQKGDE